jgi:deoxycytidylate deaminase
MLETICEVSVAALQRPRTPCELCGKLITNANIKNHRKTHHE